MDEVRYWQQKHVQYFHDPPGKPYRMIAGRGGHWALARELFDKLHEARLTFYRPRPDRAAAGADRPVVSPPTRTKGRSPLGNVYYHTPGDNVVLHPLARETALRISRSDGAVPRDPQELDDVDQEQRDAADRLNRIEAPGWDDPVALRGTFLRVWRRMREELAGGGRDADPLWELMPADTRCPDHSIWDHLRMVSALAFLDTPLPSKQPVPIEKTPWLVVFAIGPVQTFIAQARTSRDLWTGSFLLADLALHAMRPIVDRYGPDQILYPDLHRNPRVDRHWADEQIAGRLHGVLHDDANPSTFAALLPEKFVAVLPRGGAGHLDPMRKVLAECEEAVQVRWAELAGGVRDWLSGSGSPGGWEPIWDRQHRQVVRTTWSAVPWLAPERGATEDDFVAVSHGGALPAQDHSRLPVPSEAGRQAMAARQARLAPWIPPGVWAYYERVRGVFARTNLGYLEGERGFDYALAHHQVRVRHAMRKQTATYVDVEEGGEKCTTCQEREALWPGRDRARSATVVAIDGRRATVREFWKARHLDPDETGAERLCGVCAFKRYLVPAHGLDAGLNRMWAGIGADDDWRDDDGRVRLPFPSTAALANQEFLAAVATEPRLREQLRAVVERHREAGRPRTAFPRTLPRLSQASRDATQEGRRWLMLEAQHAFPETIESDIERLRAEREQERNGTRRTELEQQIARLRRLHEAARDLLDASREIRGLPTRETRVAVVRVDGDALGRLLLGDPEVVRSRWCDIIHPTALERMRRNDDVKSCGWMELLDRTRLMGPALHAFISRALATFSHRIVPWVVEREFGGRLVYAGGDDVLALCPAADALPLAARLQQLYSAAWVIDTQPRDDNWSWRRKGASESFDPDAARDRFRVVVADGGRTIDLPVVPIEEPVRRLEQGSLAGERRIATEDVRGPILPLLGGHSLSAGIVFAHFKTSLGLLLRKAATLLDDVAKEQSGRSSVAMALHSRGGEKTRLAVRWQDDAVHAERRVQRVIRAFVEDELPGRLPYKLRDAGIVARRVFEANELSGSPGQDETPAKAADRLLDGLLRRAFDRPPRPELVGDVLAIWKAGFRLAGAEPARSADGLLLCRALARPGEDE